MLVPAAGAIELDGHKKDERQDGDQDAGERAGNEDAEQIASTATSRTAEMGGVLVVIVLLTIAEVVHYPLDTIKTRLQASNSGKLFKGVYDGVGPTLVFTAFNHIGSVCIRTPVLEHYLALPHTARAPSVILLAAMMRWLAGYLVWVPFEVSHHAHTLLTAHLLHSS
jgi:hypothetical protein